MSDIYVKVHVMTSSVDRLLWALGLAVSPEAAFKFLQTTWAPWYHSETVQRFAFEGDFRSGSWEPLEDSTERIRVAEGYAPDEINIRDADLFHFAQTSSTSLVPQDGAIITVPENQSPGFATWMKYTTAQMGRSALENPWYVYGVHRDTPPRPVVALAPEDMTSTLVMYSGWLTANIRALL